jgi:hypothetical protein
MTFSDIKDRIGEALKPTSHLGLSYYDVYVTPDDIRCLKMDWLTDNVSLGPVCGVVDIRLTSL